MIRGEIPEEARKSLEKKKFFIMKRSNIVGGDPMWTAIGVIGAASVAGITKVVVELIKAKVAIEVEIDGLKIKGVEMDKIEEIINKKVGNAKPD